MSDLPRELSLGIQENLFRILGRFPEIATRHDYYLATAYTVQNLTSGTWYFAIIAVTSGGTRSALSNVVSTTL